MNASRTTRSLAPALAPVLGLALGLLTATPTTAQDPAAMLDACIERNRMEREVPCLHASERRS